MGAMLLEDYRHGEVPESITHLLEYFRKNDMAPDKNDILAGFIYILMLESGFVSKNYTGQVADCDFNYKRLLELSSVLPEAWKRHRNYHFEFILQSAPEFVCKITCITACEDFVINCTVKDLPECFSIMLDPLTYFISSNVQLTSGYNVFQNLRQLSKNFKDEIAFPVKCVIVFKSGGICACFQHLPRELSVEILGYLKINDLLSFAKTSRYFCASVQDASLWVKLLDLDFRKRNVCKTVEELRFLYDIKYGRQLAKIMSKGP